MMKTYKYTFVFLMLLLLISCKQTENENLKKLLSEWTGKEILFPDNPSFTIYGEQKSDFKIPTNGYKVVHYLDSTGCISCKLNLNKWKEYIEYMDSVTNGTVPCIFFFHAKEKREVKISLKEQSFNYPICMDTANEFYQLNRFPMYPILQTFLLDKNNCIVAMGDPVTNPKIKELYLNLINGKQSKQELEQTKTTATVSTSIIHFNSFFWEEKQDTTITLINTGNKPLVIHDIATSCGCTVADYDKRPAMPGKSIEVKITFKADYPEQFNKTIGIYCNTSESPYVIRVKGKAEKIQTP